MHVITALLPSQQCTLVWPDDDDFQERRRQGIQPSITCIGAKFQNSRSFELADHVNLDKRGTRRGGLRGSSSLLIDEDSEICTVQSPFQ
jgi:hypothetical protein